MSWSEQDDNRVREFCNTVDVGKLTKCPKCGMGEHKGEMMLVHLCTHKYCPFRDYKNKSDPYHMALTSWKNNGGIRPNKRPDGILTRCDRNWFSPAEIAITKAMYEVEKRGGSIALTDAIILLSKARDRVADHIEGNEL